MNRKWFPIIFFLAVFFFMVVFRHEEYLSGSESRQIEQVTFEEDWAEHGNIPEHLRDITRGLDGPLRSKIIHKVINGETLNVLYLPSTPFFERTVRTDIEEQQPLWLEKTEEILSDVYKYDFVGLLVLPPDALRYELPEDGEVIEDDDDLNDEAPYGELPAQEEEPDAPEPSYLQSVRELRELEPDVILLDMALIAEHLDDSEYSVEGYTAQVLELLETLYRPRDRYFTYMLAGVELHEALFFEREDTTLNDHIERLSEQLDFGVKQAVIDFERGAAYMPEDQLHERWARQVMVPLFYRGIIPE
ncbi:hypothetical protein [Evansella clarkii]|uniref:hypothetical protein n=1 Tax=Evansella clarkii TaxID=79879 RepID=UPI000B441A24|nr:hypothetical protein [Evansella clarkii]